MAVGFDVNVGNVPAGAYEETIRAAGGSVIKGYYEGGGVYHIYASLPPGVTPDLIRKYAGNPQLIKQAAEREHLEEIGYDPNTMTMQTPEGGMSIAPGAVLQENPMGPIGIAPPQAAAIQQSQGVQVRQPYGFAQVPDVSSPQETAGDVGIGTTASRLLPQPAASSLPRDEITVRSEWEPVTIQGRFPGEVELAGASAFYQETVVNPVAQAIGPESMGPSYSGGKLVTNDPEQFFRQIPVAIVSTPQFLLSIPSLGYELSTKGGLQVGVELATGAWGEIQARPAKFGGDVAGGLLIGTAATKAATSAYGYLTRNRITYGVIEAGRVQNLDVMIYSQYVENLGEGVTVRATFGGAERYGQVDTSLVFRQKRFMRAGFPAEYTGKSSTIFTIPPEGPPGSAASYGRTIITLINRETGEARVFLGATKSSELGEVLAPGELPAKVYRGRSLSTEFTKDMDLENLNTRTSFFTEKVYKLTRPDNVYYGRAELEAGKKLGVGESLIWDIRNLDTSTKVPGSVDYEPPSSGGTEVKLSGQDLGSLGTAHSAAALEGVKALLEPAEPSINVPLPAVKTPQNQPVKGLEASLNQEVVIRESPGPGGLRADNLNYPSRDLASVQLPDNLGKLEIMDIQASDSMLRQLSRVKLDLASKQGESQLRAPRAEDMLGQDSGLDSLTIPALKMGQLESSTSRTRVSPVEPPPPPPVFIFPPLSGGSFPGPRGFGEGSTRSFRVSFNNLLDFRRSFKYEPSLGGLLGLRATNSRLAALTGIGIRGIL